MADKKHYNDGCSAKAEAEKHMKTSFLKWRPDFEQAADAYMKAATSFRIAKSFDVCEESLMQAINCYKNTKSWYHAAKAYEQIILVHKEKNAMSDVETLANKAANLYQQHGSNEAAAMALEKTAKIVEGNHPEVALRLYQHALEIVQIEDSTRDAASYSAKISRLLVKLNMFDNAADALRREIGINQQLEAYGPIGRLAVALVLVQLGRGDFVAAEKAFKEWGNYCDPQEIQTLELLLQAFDDDDMEAANIHLNSPFIKHMDVEYAKLARGLGAQGLSRSSNKPPKADATEGLDEESNNDIDLC